MVGAGVGRVSGLAVVGGSGSVVLTLVIGLLVGTVAVMVMAGFLVGAEVALVVVVMVDGAVGGRTVDGRTVDGRTVGGRRLVTTGIVDGPHGQPGGGLSPHHSPPLESKSGTTTYFAAGVEVVVVEGAAALPFSTAWARPNCGAAAAVTRMEISRNVLWFLRTGPPPYSTGERPCSCREIGVRFWLHKMLGGKYLMAKHSMRSHSYRHYWLYMVLLVGGIGLLGCSGETSDTIVVEAELAGRAVSSSSVLDPIELNHGQTPVLRLDLLNRSDEPATIAHVRLEGRMFDLVFLTYDTGIHEVIQPQERKSITFPLDFYDLNGQAHGLLRSRISLYNTEREPLGHQDLIVDGRGSPFATMGVFTLLLAGLAAAGLGWNLLRMAQRRLPINRFARAATFAPVGAGVGLAVAAACSTLRIWPLATSAWVLVVVVAALIGFAGGYLTPGSAADLDDLVADLVEKELADGNLLDRNLLDGNLLDVDLVDARHALSGLERPAEPAEADNDKTLLSTGSTVWSDSDR